MNLHKVELPCPLCGEHLQAKACPVNIPMSVLFKSSVLFSLRCENNVLYCLEKTLGWWCWCWIHNMRKENVKVHVLQEKNFCL